MTEQEILAGCLSKDSLAQRELYNRYSPKMLSVCYRFGQNRDDAEDMLQEGFIRVFTQIHSFRNSGSFEGWMKRIFVNTALEHYRTNKNMMMQSDVEAAMENPHHDFTVEKISKKEKGYYFGMISAPIMQEKVLNTIATEYNACQ